MLKVIGIGNMLRGDDAIGPVIVGELDRLNKPYQVKPIDAGADPFTVLDHLIGKDPVIIIDCAKMGNKPGFIKHFSVDAVNISHLAKSVSLHGYGFADIYKMAREIGTVAPCSIIGVEPKSIDFNTGLSEEVQSSIPQIIKLVNEEARNYA